MALPRPDDTLDSSFSEAERSQSLGASQFPATSKGFQANPDLSRAGDSMEIESTPSVQRAGPAGKAPAVPAADKPKAKKKKEPTSSRSGGGGGASVFPMAKIQRILKCEGTEFQCQKESVFIVSMATELFIKKLTESAYTNARLDKRKFVQYRDLAKAVSDTEELFFLEKVIPPPITLASALNERKRKQAKERGEDVEDNEEGEDGHDDDIESGSKARTSMAPSEGTSAQNGSMRHDDDLEDDLDMD